MDWKIAFNTKLTSRREFSTVKRKFMVDMMNITNYFGNAVPE